MNKELELAQKLALNVKIEYMKRHPGMYMTGDILAPNATIPIWSEGGKLHPILLDDPLSDDGWYPTLTINGPFHKLGEDTHGSKKKST